MEKVVRDLSLPQPLTESFFLWGARQTGKSTLLRDSYPNALEIDLLDADAFVRYSTRPQNLREELASLRQVGLVVIDEIQKVPSLLDEIHWLLTHTPWLFALCGSSARKLRRGHANLLGGRALRFELYGLTAHELGGAADLSLLLNRGYLPKIYGSNQAKDLLRSYVSDYLQEEIAAEALTRNLPAFARFLEVAALGDSEVIAYATMARDCGVSAPTIREYFQILVDTLLGAFVPAYTVRPKRRVTAAPKFYFGDVGVVNQLAKRRDLETGSAAFGKAFENWVHHELRTHRAYSGLWHDLAYWRLASGTEVDFVVGQGAAAIEAKATKRVTTDHLRGLREFKQDHPQTSQLVLVSLEERRRQTSDGILILPWRDFSQWVWTEACWD